MAKLIIGEKGTGKHKLLREMLVRAYGEDYATSGDYHEISVSGIESVREALDELSLAPIKLPKLVCVLDGIEKLSMQAQGAMLKPVEDGEIDFYLVSESSPIETIVSRCDVVRTYPTPYDEYVAGGKGLFQYCLTGGCDVEVPVDEQMALRTVYNTLLGDGENLAKDVLRALSLYEEKDANAFSVKYKDDNHRLFRMVGQLCILSILGEVNIGCSDVAAVEASNFCIEIREPLSKNEFFDKLVQLLSIMERK